MLALLPFCEAPLGGAPTRWAGLTAPRKLLDPQWILVERKATGPPGTESVRPRLHLTTSTMCVTVIATGAPDEKAGVPIKLEHRDEKEMRSFGWVR